MILDNVVPWGRNFSEYQEMFTLTALDLKSTILGCSDGPSSFNHEATAKGCHVISLDPIYAFSKEQIRERVDQTRQTILEQVAQSKDDFVWSSITSLEALEEVRIRAMHTFLDDYDQGKSQGRYIQGALPSLPFQDHAFDLVLCSHFLFLYSEHFDQQFHRDSITELCRVANEVRIFPLVDLTGRKSPFLKPIIKFFAKQGYHCTIESVSYEFQKGADEMLRITL